MIGRYPRYRELWERFRASGDSPERAEKIFPAAGLHRPASPVADRLVRRILSSTIPMSPRSSKKGAALLAGRSEVRDSSASANSWARFCPLTRPLPSRERSRFRPRLSTIPFCRWSATPIWVRSHRRACRCRRTAFAIPKTPASNCCAASICTSRSSAFVPQGVWPSEGSVSEEVLAIAQSLGVKWMATDEGVLGRSLGVFFSRDGNGRLTGNLAEKLYTIHRYENGSTRDAHGLPRPHHLRPDRICLLRNACPDELRIT